MSTPIPPGQTPGAFQRFGPPGFARIRPQVAAQPVVTVSGAATRPVQLPLAALLALGVRTERRADLHCVTTWSALDLTWGGVPFRSVHDGLCRDVGVSRSARWVTFVGLDGYRACLRLDDALGDNVLLADHLDGAPLPPAHGAPLRLVAPAQYGYKSVKHVCAIEYRQAYDSGTAGWTAHPRGRVAREERSRYLPGPMWRVVWRTLLPRARRSYANQRSVSGMDPPG
jgi:DMSO/TMAO reductase YedYZ molybdopterin-dependent catalytic subunit